MCQKVIKGSWYERIKYTDLIYENSLLIIRQTPCNSKILINNIIDLYDRLVKEYKRERDMRWQKIVSNLNYNTKEYTLILLGNAKEYIPILIREENSAICSRDRLNNKK